MGIALNEEIRRLLDGRHFGVLATLNPDGGPRASITVLDSQDPYNYVELRGRATIEEDVGRAFDTGLSWKYDGRDPDPDPPGAVRLIVRMTVDKATGYAA